MKAADARFLRRFCEAKFNMLGFSKKVRDELWEAALAEGPSPVAVERVYGNAAGIVNATAEFIHEGYERRAKAGAK